MKTQRRKFTIEGEFENPILLNENAICLAIKRALSRHCNEVDINEVSVSIDAVPTENSMKEKPFDPKKPFTLRCGVPATLMAEDMAGDRPLAVRFILPGEKNETVGVYRRSGLVYEGQIHDYDLINIPKKFERWCNIYRDYTAAHDTKEQADHYRNEGCLACAPLPWTEGEGLS